MTRVTPFDRLGDDVMKSAERTSDETQADDCKKAEMLRSSSRILNISRKTDCLKDFHNNGEKMNANIENDVCNACDMNHQYD